MIHWRSPAHFGRVRGRSGRGKLKGKGASVSRDVWACRQSKAKCRKEKRKICGLSLGRFRPHSVIRSPACRLRQHRSPKWLKCQYAGDWTHRPGTGAEGFEIAQASTGGSWAQDSPCHNMLLWEPPRAIQITETQNESYPPPRGSVRQNAVPLRMAQAIVRNLFFWWNSEPKISEKNC